MKMMSKDIYINEAFRLANSGQSLFVTGKAGTGKTTLLKRIVERAKNNKKNVVVLSSTGVAAKNAQGVTIHSFFRLPLSPYIPGYSNKRMYNLSGEEIDLIRRLHIIVVDEVSMVRCDLMDMMDDVLRHYRKDERPFGGVQMLFFGDLYQLMPVVSSEDSEKLKGIYPSYYFFSSKVYEQMECPMIELKKVYRQTEGEFVKLLNHVRIGMILPTELKLLQGRYFPLSKGNGKTIRLTTHNYKAKNYNQNQLEALNGMLEEYKAYIDGWFPKEEWPTDYCLKLKKNARVMFVKNDAQKQFINGTLGTVIALYSNEIVVETDEGKRIEVKRQKWDKLHYIINKKTKEIETEECGSFSQFPLRLAWAVTIHKSQGLTFDDVIVDAGRAFAYGQVYVALSRCRKFHGIILASPISEKSVKTDPIVVKFMNETKRVEVETEDVDVNTVRICLSNTEQRTLWMSKEGLSIEDMARESGERIEYIYSHLKKLIENNMVDITSFLSKEKYEYILKAINESDDPESLTEIMSLCPKGTKYGEIRMAMASLKAHQDKCLVEEECDQCSGWHFVSNVDVYYWSDAFFNEKYQVAMAEDGYYLWVIDEFIKLGDYPSKSYAKNGWISFRFVDRKTLSIAHICKGRKHIIGSITEEENKLVFVTPESAEYVINFERDS